LVSEERRSKRQNLQANGLLRREEVIITAGIMESTGRTRETITGGTKAIMADGTTTTVVEINMGGDRHQLD